VSAKGGINGRMIKTKLSFDFAIVRKLTGKPRGEEDGRGKPL